MTDDKILKDTARDPERESLGSMRGGVRATAGKAARKVTKKAARKKTAKKAAATAGKTTKKAAKTAAKRNEPAPTKARAAAPEAPAPRTAKVSAARSKAAPAKATAATSVAAKGATTASESAGSAPRTARALTAKSRTASARAATNASAADVASDAVASGATASARGSAASAPAAPAAASREAGPPAEASRPPAPMPPGVYADPQEQPAGFGSLLALWGPLIIVGFLVLVFRGGAERTSAVAAGPDASAQSAAVEVAAAPAVDTPAQTASGSGARRGADPSTGARTPEHVSDLPGAGRMVAEAFDRGFAMRTSMAGGPAFAGRESDTPMPAGAPGRLYPPPPGPYRDPRYRGLPTDESWPAAAAGDWTAWSTGGREDTGSEDGDDARAQWVRCAPPYYWCPAPGNPAW